VSVTNIGRTVTKGSLEGLSLNEMFKGNSAQNEQKSFLTILATIHKVTTLRFIAGKIKVWLQIVCKSQYCCSCINKEKFMFFFQDDESRLNLQTCSAKNTETYI